MHLQAYCSSWTTSCAVVVCILCQVPEYEIITPTSDYYMCAGPSSTCIMWILYIPSERSVIIDKDIFVWSILKSFCMNTDKNII
jgi:hypothetical protein